MEWLVVLAIAVAVVGALMVYGGIVRRRMTPAEREAERDRSLASLFEKWYQDRRRFESFVERVPPERADPMRRRFARYVEVRDYGFDHVHAWVVSVDATLPGYQSPSEPD